MRVVTVRADGRTHAGRVEDDQVVLLPPRDVGELLAADSDWRRTAADGSTAWVNWSTSASRSLHI
ncbi:hypothetical protein BH24ACT15_BH24ACT15_26400 [soil metagenome]|jgi:hypothetical protein